MRVGVTDCVPESVLVPVQPPEAVQELALVEDQLSVDAAPEVTLVGFAEIVTVTFPAVELPVVPPVVPLPVVVYEKSLNRHVPVELTYQTLSHTVPPVSGMFVTL